MYYLAQVHWVESDKAKDNQIAVLSANARTYQEEAKKAKQDADVLIGKKDNELKKALDDLRAANTANAELRDQLAKAKEQSTKETAVSSASVTEVGKRQEDVAMLRETLRKEQERNNTLVKENAKFQNEATVAGIERRAVQDQNNRLEAQLQQMARDMARMRASGGSTATARAGNGKNPPPESIEGLVQRTDPRSGLMTLTIGSDSGLAKNHTLELFRLNPSAPSQSKYLGTVRILDVDAKTAVAQPVGRLAAPPQAGDRVASRILGS
jgi:hypothetical protein